MEQVITLTMNPTIDKSSSVDHVVAEKKLRCKAPTYEPGGGGINVSRAIAKLGGDSLALYPAGGHNGAKLTDLLDREKIRHRPVQIEDWTRENFTVFEESTEQQYRFGMPGPTLRKEEWEQCMDAVFEHNPAPAYIVGSGSLPPGVPEDFYARLSRKARDAGARVIVDTSGSALPKALEEGVFLIKPNLRELSQITGQEFETEAQQEELVQNLVRENKAQVVVLSLGAAGVLAAWDDTVTRMRAPTVPIRSKVGAGDSTVGGIVFALAQGFSMEDAIRYGMAAGAAAVMTPGTELCRKPDVERLYDQLRSPSV